MIVQSILNLSLLTYYQTHPHPHTLKKRKKFDNWIWTNFRKEETTKILFSDEKMFDIDGVYNSQNDRVWAVNRAEADKKDGIKQKRKFS